MTNKHLKVCVVGASGRMGIEVIREIEADPETVLSGAIERSDNEKIGTSALELAGCGHGGCVVTSDIESVSEVSDIIIDFSGAEGTHENINSYWSADMPLVVGSTGLSDVQLEELLKLQKYIPLLVSSNMSLGVNVITKLAEIAAQTLGSDFDIEIFEAHHKHKKDAPSGTALKLSETVANARGLTGKTAVYSRHGHTGERKKDIIGFQVMRGGDIAGEHTVFFCGEGERVEITHRATSRHIFAKGAVKAAKWLAAKPNGLYSMKDVLGLK